MASRRQTHPQPAANHTTGHWTAAVSRYYSGHRRARQVRRVHLIPPAGLFPGRSIITAACGAPWWDTTNAANQPVPVGGPLPDDLTWCPKCQGVAAEKLGLTGQVAELIAEAIGTARPAGKRTTGDTR